MSAAVSQPHVLGPARAQADPQAGSADLESHLVAAVREGAVRAAVATGLGAVAAIHAVDAVGKWSETRYLFWMYVAAIVGAVVVAAAVLFTRSRAALVAAAGVAGIVLLGYVVNRTVGLPNATDDIGNWTEPLGLASIVVEAATVAVAVGGLAARGTARGLMA